MIDKERRAELRATIKSLAAVCFQCPYRRSGVCVREQWVGDGPCRVDQDLGDLRALLDEAEAREEQPKPEVRYDEEGHSNEESNTPRLTPAMTQEPPLSEFEKRYYCERGDCFCRDLMDLDNLRAQAEDQPKEPKKVSREWFEALTVAVHYIEPTEEDRGGDYPLARKMLREKGIEVEGEKP